MTHKFAQWRARSTKNPNKFSDIKAIIEANRDFHERLDLHYGDHGLETVVETVARAVKERRRIALYADYDVDGTMSCVSWIWFFQAIGYDNYIHYIPCRFKEGYGLNLEAMRRLVEDDHARLIITMDTGITANAEAAYCKERGVDFICTDHHTVQPENMPDSVILNPKFHPIPDYQELCGCGITFVLLRRLAQEFPVPGELWTDLLALTGMATICDVVPLNSVNHRLARLGVDALMKSRRPVLRKLREAAQTLDGIDERDVGFRLGPRINAVGRLEHADKVIEAFLDDRPESLIAQMGQINEKRKAIQKDILEGAAAEAAKYADDPVLFLGGEWHQGVVGICASKISEQLWRPVWLFQRGEVCKGSARSIPGFDVTAAMSSAAELFAKFGGHTAAGGFSFPARNEPAIREALCAYAIPLRQSHPEIWQSKIDYDCELSSDFLDLDLLQVLDEMKPFGHGFEAPRFLIKTKIESCRILADKKTGDPRHTELTLKGASGQLQRAMIFGEVADELHHGTEAELLVSVARNTFRGRVSLGITVDDYR